MTSQRGRISVTSFFSAYFPVFALHQTNISQTRETTTTFTTGFLAKEARFARNNATELCFTQEPSESLGYDSNCP
ncbi:hypothetical protein BDB00DRAFT_837845 [Zychaea mexicana]|uniref:uncharacterized protein n=1 Tax=Zychaea mexicana TaxID=64656 RepID=UPI0022FE9898|nr:uncharacterized protein BDB00DRAFT_837845 [Zychaea mexicana]KAI9490440.1 hypothetical protein BDB00DRAFT_837845 [Zychaea mexicana]